MADQFSYANYIGKKSAKFAEKSFKRSAGLRGMKFGEQLGQFKQVLGALGFGAGDGSDGDSYSASEERARSALDVSAIGQREGAAAAAGAMEQEFALGGGNIKDPAQRALLAKGQQARRVGTEQGIADQRANMEMGFMQTRQIELDRGLRERLALMQMGTSLWGQFQR